MNQAQQLVQVTRQLDSLLRRLDVPFDDWVEITKASVHKGKIPSVEELAVLCTDENPRPALAGSIKDERKRAAKGARAKAEAAIAAADAAAALVQTPVQDGGAS